MTRVRSILLPLAAVALALLAWVAASDSGSPRPPTTVPVNQATYACPAGAGITVSAGQVRAGSRSTASVLPGRTEDEVLADAGSWRTAVVDGEGVIIQQQGRGSGPVGYFSSTASKRDGGGLEVGACPGVVDDAWLLGLGSGGKHFSTLTLTNLAEAPAAVDLTLWGPEGEIDAVNADGIVVKPFSVRRIRLDALAAGEPDLAVHLRRSRGSLSVVANDTSTATFKGTEPVSSTRAPRLDQIVGGVVKGSTGRTLLVLNPGGTTARVDVDVIGSQSTFSPSGLQDIQVKAGTVRSITMPKAAGESAQALRVRSDRPVAATVRLAPTTEDYAFAESVPPLTGPAVVPIDIGPDAGTPRLVLSAPGAAASVDVIAYGADMTRLGSTSVSIAAGTTQESVIEQKEAAFVVLRPRGNVVAAATYTKAGRISSLAIGDAPLTVLGPQVRPVD